MRRYHLGQMTVVEQHLVEQHLVECDLCNDALATLENPANIESFQQLSHQLSQYIQREFAPAPPPVRQQKQFAAKQPQQERKTFTDSAQSYFWTIIFLAFGGGGIFLLQQHLKNRPPMAVLPARAAEVVVLPAPRGAEVGNYQAHAEPVQEPLVIQTKYSNRDTSRISAAVTPVPTRDTAQKKKIVKDSALPKLPPADTNTRKLAAQTPPPPAETPKDPPKEPQKEAPKEKAPEPAPVAKAEKEEEPAAKPANGDDYVYRSAMQYQQQGDYNEAINQFRKLSDKGKYAERARYQMAICYRAKGQKGKARRMLRDIANSESPMKSLAQEELSSMN